MIAKGANIMATDLVTDYLTVAEAASLLHVSQPTIRRWIAQGALPAYRIGQRRVALKRADLASMIQPVRAPTGSASACAGDDPVWRPLTPEEIERGLAAMAAAEKLSDEIMARRGIDLVTPASWEILNELRDERSRQLS